MCTSPQEEAYNSGIIKNTLKCLQIWLKSPLEEPKMKTKRNAQKLTKKFENYGPTLHLKRIIKVSETLWHQFHLVAFSGRIDKNLFLQKTKQK